MKAKSRQSGLTLMEQVVVIAAIALLIVFGLPAVRALFKSIESRGGERAMISASLASARAIAAKEQHYAGIRFQNRYQEDGQGCQYVIFIVHEEPSKMDDLTIGFRAVEGIEPIKLPDNIGVMDLRVRTNHNPGDRPARDTADEPIEENDLDDTILERTMTDTSAFSIVFSPSGRLVIHDVRVRNRDGDFQPVNLNDSADDIFNSPVNIIDNKTGMFIQDDYSERGLGAEPSRNNFAIYDKIDFSRMDKTARFDYLQSLDKIYINPYTGTMINR